MDPDLLHRLREQSGLRLDREGRFWHRSNLLEHARTLAASLAWSRGRALFDRG